MTAVGFWSYAHDDNRSAGDGILAPAQAVAAEYDLLTGEELRVFVDRDAIEWGDNWRAKIDAGLTEDNPDELIATTARTQYVDWSKLRLVAPASSEHREAAHSLAARLVEIEGRMAAVQIDNEQSSSTEDEADGLAELIAKIDALIPDWLDAVIAARTVAAQLKATDQTYDQEEVRLRRRGAPRSAITARKLRFGSEMHPVMTRYHALATTYSSRTIVLDPLVTKVLRAASGHPDDLALISDISDSVDEAMINIEANGKTEAPTAHGWYEEHSRLSRTFRELARLEKEGLKMVDEGNAIVERWAAQLEELRAKALS
ncbi:hypothetical protein ACFFSW_12900 [Saccharothrix longispora]|uniref:Uncharacterized protein n=1 Tax=Saccharothrix longispora TaxID=33920 RepID=A0ABU1Q4D7_9PSEU|nr:hypothetical protein [Saccharothrix longispora]MDR6597760.1 hypothetical protein [Saccharothrix longispora]